MSIQKIIQESINGNPLEMKEAIQEELRARVAETIAAKMSDDEEDEDENDEEDEDHMKEALAAPSDAYLKQLHINYKDKSSLSKKDAKGASQELGRWGKSAVKKIADANIKHISSMASDEYKRRGGK
jgi:hypothetical protein